MQLSVASDDRWMLNGEMMVGNCLKRREEELEEEEEAAFCRIDEHDLGCCLRQRVWSNIAVTTVH